MQFVCIVKSSVCIEVRSTMQCCSFCCSLMQFFLMQYGQRRRAVRLTTACSSATLPRAITRPLPVRPPPPQQPRAAAQLGVDCSPHRSSLGLGRDILQFAVRRRERCSLDHGPVATMGALRARPYWLGFPTSDVVFCFCNCFAVHTTLVRFSLASKQFQW